MEAVLTVRWTRLIESKNLSRSLAAAAVVLLGASIVSDHVARQYFADGSKVAFVPEVMSFGRATAGSVFPVTFTLRNESAKPVRVVGQVPACYKGGCIRVDGIPFEVPANSDRKVLVEMTAKSEGDFAGEAALFLDRPGFPKVVLGVRGRIEKAF